MWSTKAPSVGTIADEKNSHNTLAVVGPKVFVASGNERLFAYDDAADTFTPAHTLTDTAGAITTVAQWLNQQCAFCSNEMAH